jgi:hypothetical protein
MSVMFVFFSLHSQVAGAVAGAVERPMTAANNQTNV